MQLVAIHCSRPDHFAPIEFNFGAVDPFNVVYGEVTKPRSKRRDSHNLGKTTLITVIDFLLLSGLGETHIFVKHRDLFEELAFYLEIETTDGCRIGIRRCIEDTSKVDLVKSEDPIGDLSDSSDLHWNHVSLPLEKARSILDGWLGFNVLKPYTYRKAITYFLRSQGDWSDYLQVQKFSKGREEFWKPFVASLFGYDHEMLKQKYELEARANELSSSVTKLKARTDHKEEDLPEIGALIRAKQSAFDDKECQLDNFQFEKADRKLIERLVGGIEVAIVEKNSEIYDLSYDLREIEMSLGTKDKFDLEKTKDIFEQAGIAFPDQIQKSYEDLLAFRRAITLERNKELRKQKKVLSARLEEARSAARHLDNERKNALESIDKIGTLSKYKALQRELARDRRALDKVKADYEQLRKYVEAKRELEAVRRKQDEFVSLMRRAVEDPPARLLEFQALFDGFCREVLQLAGIFSFTVNSKGTLTHKVSLNELDGMKSITSQADGDSYRKMTAALFDLALLITFKEIKFFRFVYHDGVLEGLDDRKKIAFLSLVRNQIRSFGIQYILTSISSDLPRDEDDERVTFSPKEIVVRLHDGGDNGRLFKGPPF